MQLLHLHMDHEIILSPVNRCLSYAMEISPYLLGEIHFEGSSESNRSKLQEIKRKVFYQLHAYIIKKD